MKKITIDNFFSLDTYSDPMCSQYHNQMQCVMISRRKSGARLFMACEQMFQIIFFLRKNRFLLLTYSQSDLSYSHLVSQQEITPM